MKLSPEQLAQYKQQVENQLQALTQISDEKHIQTIAAKLGNIDNEATTTVLCELLKNQFNNTSLANAFYDLGKLLKGGCKDHQKYQNLLKTLVASSAASPTELKSDLTFIEINDSNRVFVIQLITLLKGLYKRSQYNATLWGAGLADTMSKTLTGLKREEIAKKFEEAAINLSKRLTATPLAQTTNSQITSRDFISSETHIISAHIDIDQKIRDGVSVSSHTQIRFFEEHKNSTTSSTEIQIFPVKENKQNKTQIPADIEEGSKQLKKLIAEVDAKSIKPIQIKNLLKETQNLQKALLSYDSKLSEQKFQAEGEHKEYQAYLQNFLQEQSASSLSEIHSKFEDEVKNCMLYQNYLDELESMNGISKKLLTILPKSIDEDKQLKVLVQSYQSGKTGSHLSFSAWQNWYGLEKTKSLLQALLKNKIEESLQRQSILKNNSELGLFLQNYISDVSAKILEIGQAKQSIASYLQETQKTEENLLKIQKLGGDCDRLEILKQEFDNMLIILSTDRHKLTRSDPKTKSSSIKSFSSKSVYDEIHDKTLEIAAQLREYQGTLFKLVHSQKEQSSVSYTLSST